MNLRQLLFKFYSSYKVVMDADYNPLRHVPDPAARFWIMTVLAWCWCIVFGLSLGSVVLMGTSFVAHLSILLMIFFTASVFYDAEKRHDSWLLALKLNHSRSR